MDRLTSSGARNNYVDQIDEWAGNPINEQDQDQPTQPVMRQRETGREDDEDEKDQPKNSSLLNQHSKPQLTSRSGANQASLQLEPKDEEKFVYTKKYFYEGIEQEGEKDGDDHLGPSFLGLEAEREKHEEGANHDA
jgi:hypothetical protein